MNEIALKVWSFYVHRGCVYLSVTARTVAGFFNNIEPMRLLPVSDTEALKAGLIDVMRQGNPTISTPDRDDDSLPLVLKYSKLKSWTIFQKDAQAWNISAKDGVYRICKYRRRSNGQGYEEDPAAVVTLSSWPAIEEVATRVTDLVQASTAV